MTAFRKPAWVRMSADPHRPVSVRPGSRNLSYARLVWPISLAAVTMLPTPEKNSTTSKSRGTAAKSESCRIRAAVHPNATGCMACHEVQKLSGLRTLRTLYSGRNTSGRNTTEVCQCNGKSLQEAMTPCVSMHVFEQTAGIFFACRLVPSEPNDHSPGYIRQVGIVGVVLKTEVC